MAKKKQIGILLGEKDLRRRYPDSGLAGKICLEQEDTLRLPSTNIALNYHTGGGLPYGKIIEVSGEESTGKTLMAIDLSKVTQLLGGVVLWSDPEASFDPKWMKAHGLDLDRIQLLPIENVIEIISDWIADYCIYWRSKLVNNEPILLVIDSIAALEARDAMDTAQVDTKAEMGRRSFKMGEMLRKRNKIFAKYGICVFFVNQLRKKIGATQFEDPDTTPMAQCMKYYASQRLGLYRGKRIRIGDGKKSVWVGNLVYIRTKKNKTSIPRDNIKAEVYFRKSGENFGYHKYHGLGDLLLKKGIIKKRGKQLYFKDELVCKYDKLGENLRQAIADNSELRSRLIKKLGVNTVSKTRKKLEDIKRNLYPVKSKKKKNAQEEEEKN